MLKKNINIGLIGYGIVGSGVVKYLRQQKSYFKNKYGISITLKTICDRSVHKKIKSGFGTTTLTTDFLDIVHDESVDIVIELIGGLKLAKEIVLKSLKNKKHVITANKALISTYGRELFLCAQKNGVQLLFESAVGAGIPMIKTITEGIVGNQFDAVYGIVNGTCNFILDEMAKKGYTFQQALELAQEKGYAESDPTLDINGMDSAHKISILTQLAFGKTIKVKDVYREGITHISHEDIEEAESLGLSLKLLAISKKVKKDVEIRVHPTLISKDHPLAAINGVFNACLLSTTPLGNILLSGEGAGQMAAASGVISDLLNLLSASGEKILHSNLTYEDETLCLKKIDNIETKFYLRFMAKDNPGVLSQITNILGSHKIGINSVTQKVHQHSKSSIVPIIMLTDYTTEKSLRMALNKIHKLGSIKQKPVAIRMEKLN